MQFSSHPGVPRHWVSALPEAYLGKYPTPEDALYRILFPQWRQTPSLSQATGYHCRSAGDPGYAGGATRCANRACYATDRCTRRECVIPLQPSSRLKRGPRRSDLADADDAAGACHGKGMARIMVIPAVPATPGVAAQGESEQRGPPWQPKAPGTMAALVRADRTLSKSGAPRGGIKYVRSAFVAYVFDRSADHLWHRGMPPRMVLSHGSFTSTMALRRFARMGLPGSRDLDVPGCGCRHRQAMCQRSGSGLCFHRNVTSGLATSIQPISGHVPQTSAELDCAPLHSI